MSLSNHPATTTVTLRNGRQVMLRTVRPDDVADLIDIQKQIAEENVANVDDHVDSAEECDSKIRGIAAGDLWLVAAEGDGVVGSIRLVKPQPSFLGHIRNLFIDVHREWRGFGVGAALISAAAAWARDRGVELIALSVLDSNPRARLLYERLGFTATGHTPSLVKRPDGSRADDTQMLLRLTAGGERETHP